MTIQLNLLYIVMAVALSMGMISASMAFAQVVGNDTGTATGEEASVGETYTALAIAIVSMAGTIFAAYLSQKAKATGQAPNETDISIQQQIVRLQEFMKNSVGAQKQLIDFVYEKVAPDKAKEIIEGSLPLIKVNEVTKKVGEAEADFKHGEDLLNQIQDNVKS